MIHVGAWLRRVSITARLTVLFGLAACLVLCIIALHLYDSLDGQLAARDEDELVGKVELVRHLLSDMPSIEAIQSDSRRWNDAFVGHQGLSLNLFDRDFHLLVRTGDRMVSRAKLEPFLPATDEPRRVDWFNVEIGRPMHLVTAWAYPAGQRDRAIIVALMLDRSEHGELLAWHLRQTLIAIVVGSILAAVLAYLVSHYSLKPVRQIAAEAHRISASELAHRIDVEGTPAELREIARAFNGMLERLEDSFRRLSDFSSDLAHELRTPVNNLMGQTQVLLSRERTVAEMREVLVSNMEEYERLARMIEDILFLARADNAQATLRPETFDIGEELERVQSFFEALAEERDLRLRTHGNAVLVADRGMFRRALVNLVSNAVRYSPAGSVVTLSAECDSDGAVVTSVANQGAGIAPEQIDRVFDRFYRTDSAREGSHQGAGLGLAIVRSIMMLHGGTVRARSTPGDMTVFSLEFPAARSPTTTSG